MYHGEVVGRTIALLNTYRTCMIGQIIAPARPSPAVDTVRDSAGIFIGVIKPNINNMFIASERSSLALFFFLPDLAGAIRVLSAWYNQAAHQLNSLVGKAIIFSLLSFCGKGLPGMKPKCAD